MQIQKPSRKRCFMVLRYEHLSTSQTKARRFRASAFRLLALPGWNQNHGSATDCWKPEEMLLTLRMLEKEMVANRVMRNVFLLVSLVAASLFPLRHFSLGRIGGGNAGTAANPPQGVRKGTQAISDAFTSTSNVLEGLPGVSAAPRFDSCQSYLSYLLICSRSSLFMFRL